MAIQKLEIDGFRSFQKAIWEPGKLNLLVGPNGSGKSNLLRLLELISDTARGKLFESINNAGGMVPLLWNQEADSLGWDLRIDPVREAGQLSEIPVVFSFHVEQVGTGSGYRIAKDLLWVQAQQEKPPDGSHFWRDDDRFWILGSESGRSARNELGGKLAPDSYDLNESLIAHATRLPAAPLSTQIKQFLDSWHVCHDVQTGEASPARLAAIAQYSKSLEPDGSNLPSVLHSLYTENRDFREAIDQGMGAAFGKEYEELCFPPAAAQRIQLGVQWSSSKQPHVGQQLSDGTLRYLFLLAVLANPEPPPLIAIDEPETGLHPSMFPLVAEYAAAAAERTQVVLTSHSPEFLDAFTGCEPNVTICHWEDGRTRLLPISPDRVQEWLRQYRLGRLFTSGELDILAAAEVDTDDNAEDRFRDLPSDTPPLPAGPANPENAPHE